MRVTSPSVSSSILASTSAPPFTNKAKVSISVDDSGPSSSMTADSGPALIVARIAKSATGSACGSSLLTAISVGAWIVFSAISFTASGTDFTAVFLFPVADTKMSNIKADDTSIFQFIFSIKRKYLFIPPNTTDVPWGAIWLVTFFSRTEELLGASSMRSIICTKRSCRGVVLCACRIRFPCISQRERSMSVSFCDGVESPDALIASGKDFPASFASKKESNCSSVIKSSVVGCSILVILYQMLAHFFHSSSNVLTYRIFALVKRCGNLGICTLSKIKLCNDFAFVISEYLHRFPQYLRELL